jgi:Asp-tRNA(Asn)/Glu-tRNA(Gln) amidotransferase A subunit family amidase
LPVQSRPSARSLIAAVATGERSCADVARDALAAIENGAPLGAFVTVNPQLMDDATRLDRERAAGRAGPLHGVPIAVKDNIETADMPTTAGTVAFRELRTRRDAPAVSRLRAAGALIVGKTNLDELAIAGRGQSALGGQVRSPHDPSRHPAGSSGGSAVAVATGMAVLALGTETVNSLRYPASATGTVAIRPTLDTVPGGGMFPQSACDVVGPMARSVADAMLLLDVLRGGTGRPPPPRTLQGARIGLVTSMIGGGSEHAGVNDAIAAALERLVACGASVVPVDEPFLATAPLYERLAVQVHEVAALFADYMAELHALPDVAGLESVRSLADLLERGPHAPLVPSFIEAARRGTPEERAKEVIQRRTEAATVDRAVRALFKHERLDAVAYPLCQRPAARPIDEPSRPERNGILASTLGWPALNLPVGTATEGGVTLPVGLDLTAPPEREADLLSLALAIEERMDD